MIRELYLLYEYKKWDTTDNLAKNRFLLSLIFAANWIDGAASGASIFERQQQSLFRVDTENHYCRSTNLVKITLDLKCIASRKIGN